MAELVRKQLAAVVEKPALPVAKRPPDQEKRKRKLRIADHAAAPEQPDVTRDEKSRHMRGAEIVKSAGDLPRLGDDIGRNAFGFTQAEFVENDDFALFGQLLPELLVNSADRGDSRFEVDGLLPDASSAA